MGKFEAARSYLETIIDIIDVYPNPSVADTFRAALANNSAVLADTESLMHAPPEMRGVWAQTVYRSGLGEALDKAGVKQDEVPVVLNKWLGGDIFVVKNP